MTTRAQDGYLVLADVSGYTGFLAGTEREHAHEVMRDLLELIIAQLTPALSLAKLEGDAVFVYAPAAQLSRGEMLLELIEATYVAFRDRVDSIRRRTICTCTACRAIPSLDLKFMAHYGTFIRQTVAGQHEVVGSDVNLAHRLLKNGVREATGWPAYALFTAACLEHMGLPTADLHPGCESYEHLGEITTYSLDLMARYQTIREVRRVYLGAADADVVLTYDFAAPPPVLWDWLNDPYKRNLWSGDTHWTAETRPGGRTGVGAQNHCAHGKGHATETILDWVPFRYMTSQQSTGNNVMIGTHELEPIPAGTRLHFRVQIAAPLPRPVRRVIATLLFNTMYNMRPRWAQLNHLLTAPDLDAIAASQPTTP